VKIHKINTKTTQSKETLNSEIDVNKRKQATKATSVKIRLIII